MKELAEIKYEYVGAVTFFPGGEVDFTGSHHGTKLIHAMDSLDLKEPPSPERGLKAQVQIGLSGPQH